MSGVEPGDIVALDTPKGMMYVTILEGGAYLASNGKVCCDNFDRFILHQYFLHNNAKIIK